MNSAPANVTLVISVTFASVKGTPDCQEIQSVTLRGSTSLNAEHRSGDARMSVHRNSGKRSCCRFTTLFASKYGDANDEGNACSTSSFAISRWILTHQDVLVFPVVMAIHNDMSSSARRCLRNPK